MKLPIGLRLQKNTLEDAPAPSLKKTQGSTYRAGAALMHLTYNINKVSHVGAVGNCRVQNGWKSRIGIIDNSTHRFTSASCERFTSCIDRGTRSSSLIYTELRNPIRRRRRRVRLSTPGKALPGLYPITAKGCISPKWSRPGSRRFWSWSVAFGFGGFLSWNISQMGLGRREKL